MRKLYNDIGESNKQKAINKMEPLMYRSDERNYTKVDDNMKIEIVTDNAVKFLDCDEWCPLSLMKCDRDFNIYIEKWKYNSMFN